MARRKEPFGREDGMGLSERVVLYQEMEKLRERPLIVYVTSTRRNVLGLMDEDAIPQLQDQIAKIAPSHDRVDLLIASHGGDPMVAWRLVSMLRERFKHLTVLVPHVAFSAATLVALGADEIVMHPHGNLGPVDMQLDFKFLDPQTGQEGQDWFGFEDLEALVTFAKDTVGLTEHSGREVIFASLANQMGVLQLGRATRASTLSMLMGERLLKMHMKDTSNDRPKSIAQMMSKSFAHHGYPVSRREARELGLSVAENMPAVEEIMRKIWLDIEAELELRTPFSFQLAIASGPAAEALFAPVVYANLPVDLPGDIAAQAYEQVLEQAAPCAVAPVDVTQIIALSESARHASRFLDTSKVFAARTPDLRIRVRPVPIRQGWEALEMSQLAIALADAANDAPTVIRKETLEGVQTDPPSGNGHVRAALSELPGAALPASEAVSEPAAGPVQ